jgi:hypothetical protein
MFIGVRFGHSQDEDSIWVTYKATIETLTVERKLERKLRRRLV